MLCDASKAASNKARMTAGPSILLGLARIQRIVRRFLGDPIELPRLGPSLVGPYRAVLPRIEIALRLPRRQTRHG